MTLGASKLSFGVLKSGKMISWGDSFCNFIIAKKKRYVFLKQTEYMEFVESIFSLENWLANLCM